LSAVAAGGFASMAALGCGFGEFILGESHAEQGNHLHERRMGLVPIMRLHGMEPELVSSWSATPALAVKYT
jgi:hypothetical protein